MNYSIEDKQVSRSVLHCSQDGIRGSAIKRDGFLDDSWEPLLETKESEVATSGTFNRVEMGADSTRCDKVHFHSPIGALIWTTQVGVLRTVCATKYTKTKGTFHLLAHS